MYIAHFSPTFKPSQDFVFIHSFHSHTKWRASFSKPQDVAQSLWSLILPYLRGSNFILFFGAKRVKGCVQMSLFQTSQQQSQHNQKNKLFFSQSFHYCPSLSLSQCYVFLLSEGPQHGGMGGGIMFKQKKKTAAGPSSFSG